MTTYATIAIAVTVTMVVTGLTGDVGEVSEGGRLY